MRYRAHGNKFFSSSCDGSFLFFIQAQKQKWLCLQVILASSKDFVRINLQLCTAAFFSYHLWLSTVVHWQDMEWTLVLSSEVDTAVQFIFSDIFCLVLFSEPAALEVTNLFLHYRSAYESALCLLGARKMAALRQWWCDFIVAVATPTQCSVSLCTTVRH